MNWLLEIFSERSDQARLIAILISAIVAVFVVLLNQWFVSKRSKREILIEKIEELFSASNEYISTCRNLMEALHEHEIHHPDRYFDPPAELLNRLHDSVIRMEMICGLYFKSENFEPKDYYIFNMPIFEIASKGKELPEGDGHTAYEDSKIHIQKSRDNLNNICKRLMSKHGH